MRHDILSIPERELEINRLRVRELAMDHDAVQYPKDHDKDDQDTCPDPAYWGKV